MAGEGAVKYWGKERNIRAGDVVLVEKGTAGVVVCDFDGQAYEPGYEEWENNSGIADSGMPEKGILVLTVEFGLVYYEFEDDSIVFITSKK